MRRAVIGQPRRRVRPRVPRLIQHGAQQLGQIELTRPARVLSASRPNASVADTIASSSSRSASILPPLLFVFHELGAKLQARDRRPQVVADRGQHDRPVLHETADAGGHRVEGRGRGRHLGSGRPRAAAGRSRRGPSASAAAARVRTGAVSRRTAQRRQRGGGDRHQHERGEEVWRMPGPERRRRRAATFSHAPVRQAHARRMMRPLRRPAQHQDLARSQAPRQRHRSSC